MFSVDVCLEIGPYCETWAVKHVFVDCNWGSRSCQHNSTMLEGKTCNKHKLDIYSKDVHE